MSFILFCYEETYSPWKISAVMSYVELMCYVSRDFALLLLAFQGNSWLISGLQLEFLLDKGTKGSIFFTNFLTTYFNSQT